MPLLADVDREVARAYGVSAPLHRHAPRRVRDRRGRHRAPPPRARARPRLPGRRRPRRGAGRASRARVIEERTLVDGGQTAEAIADRLVAWLGRGAALARHRPLRRAPARRRSATPWPARSARPPPAAWRVRIAFNQDGDRAVKPLPPPPRTEPSLLEQLGVPLRAIPGDPDLMHHKYVVRDGAAVWTGSTNWTSTRGRARRTCSSRSPPRRSRAAYARDFEDLWGRGRVEGSGSFDTAPVDVGGVPVRRVVLARARPRALASHRRRASAWPSGACGSPRRC